MYQTPVSKSQYVNSSLIAISCTRYIAGPPSLVVRVPCDRGICSNGPVPVTATLFTVLTELLSVSYPTVPVTVPCKIPDHRSAALCHAGHVTALSTLSLTTLSHQPPTWNGKLETLPPESIL